MKRTLALMLLVSSTLLFDDSAYIAPETLPAALIPAPHIDAWSVLFLLLAQFVFISGLFAAYGPLCGLKRYQNRFFAPASPLALTAFAYLFMAFFSSEIFANDWWSDPRQDDAQATLWMWIFVALNLHLFAAPQREGDAHLGAGRGRSKALAWNIGAAVFLVMLITTLLMHQQQTPDATSVRSAFWLAGWMVALMAGVLLLPLLGFDDGSRPELNWVRWSCMFGPMMLFVVFEHSPFLLLGSWFAIIASTPLTWTLEESAPSPSMMHLGCIIILGLATLVVVLLSGQGLQLALPLGALLATISSTLDLRHATLSRQ